MQSSKEQKGDIKKAFFSDQCKEIEEISRMEGLEKMGTIKERNSMDLAEVEDIKKR